MNDLLTRMLASRNSDEAPFKLDNRKGRTDKLEVRNVLEQNAYFHDARDPCEFVYGAAGSMGRKAGEEKDELVRPEEQG